MGPHKNCIPALPADRSVAPVGRHARYLTLGEAVLIPEEVLQVDEIIFFIVRIGVIRKPANASPSKAGNDPLELFSDLLGQRSKFGVLDRLH